MQGEAGVGGGASGDVTSATVRHGDIATTLRLVVLLLAGLAAGAVLFVLGGIGYAVSEAVVGLAPSAVLDEAGPRSACGWLLYAATVLARRLWRSSLSAALSRGSSGRTWVASALG